MQHYASNMKCVWLNHAQEVKNLIFNLIFLRFDFYLVDISLLRFWKIKNVNKK